jgi:threonine dehydratase
VLTPAAFAAARANIQSTAYQTPLVPTPYHTPAGSPILIKAENLQPTGSFKIRGATHAIAQLTPTQRAAGVIAYSTGNHAQAVALAARRLAVRATIVMSPDVPAYKVAATEALGALVIMAAPSSAARRELAEELARSEGLSLIPPYDHLDVLAGQGTIGLEILEACRPGAIWVPIGGGGLIAGIATAVKQVDPSVLIIGVEPEWENDAYQSFHTGQRVSLPTSSASIADAIRVQTLGDLTLPLIRQYVDDVVTVSEEAIAAATRLAAESIHLILEPAGALGLAASLQYSRALADGRPAVVIGSGGNIPLDRLSAL